MRGGLAGGQVGKAGPAAGPQGDKGPGLALFDTRLFKEINIFFE